MSDGPLSPEEVAHRGFPTTFRGFDTDEVRSYLQRIANELRTSTARERELQRRLAEAEHRAANPVIDSATLTRALGGEMARILASAQEAASELRTRAEENAARILREAHDQAQRIRAQAEAILADRTEEAEAEAAEIRRAAATEAAGVLERARREAAGAMAEVEAKARQLVHEAQAARSRVIGDLTRRRRAMMTQVEQLRAGRERLLVAYRVVRRTTDDVAHELQRVEAEARDAAAAAAERAAVEPEAEELDDVLTAFPGGAGAEVGGEGAAGEQVAADAAPPVEGQGAVPTGEPVPAASPATGDEPGSSGAPAGPGGGTGKDPAVPLQPVPSVPSPASEEAETAPSVAPEVAPQEPAADTKGTGDDGGPELVGERRSSSLRLLRRPRGDARPGALDVAQSPAEGEAVRVIASVPEPAPPPPAPPPAEGAGAGDGAAAEGAGAADAAASDGPETSRPAGGAPPAPAVDELFARIRAGRAGAVAKAHEVLAAGPEAEASPPGGAAAGAGPEAERHPGPGAGGEEGLLQRRDRAVEGIEPRLARKLKRAQQDEQNEVLDRLRSSRSGAGVAAVLGSAEDQALRYRQAAEELVAAAAAAGAAFAVPGSDARPEVADVAGELASSLAEPLRRALERALGGDAGADQHALVERIGAAYRECKAQRIEGVAGDAVTAAFSLGALAALAPGTSTRWVVDDDGRPCPDCDDNALAGPTPPGEAFPTGQTHPPAHAGCRCVLAPAEVAAAVNGPG